MSASRIAPVVLVIFGLLLAAAVLEGGLRFVSARRAATFVGAPVPEPDIVPDPTLVAWFKPDYVEPDGHASYDALGFRQNGRPRVEPALGAIAFLGGSTAYGWGSNDDATIEADLQRDTGQTVVNAGFPGLTTLDTVLVYREKASQLHPSMTIVLAGLNDLYYAVDWSYQQRLRWASTSYEVGLRAEHDPALAPVTDAVDRIVVRNCFTCYYLGAAASTAFDRWQVPVLLDAAQLLGQQPMAAPNDRAMQLTAFAISDLANEVRQDNGCLVVAWQPIAGITSDATTPGIQDALAQVDQKAPGWQPIGRAMYADLRQRTEPVFDSGQAVQVDLGSALDDLPGEVYQDDGVHYSQSANQALATDLEPALATAHCR